MRRLTAVLAVLAVVGAIAVPSAGAAGYDPIASGQTVLKLAPSFARLLRSSGVKLEGQGGVEVSGRVVFFPLTAGKLEPVEAKGTMEHGGRLVFRVGAKELPLRSLQLKTTRPTSPFAAKLGGGQLKLSTGARFTGARRGFGAEFRATGMRLAAKVATRLDKKLGLRDVFRAGQAFGSAATAVEPATVGLAAGGKVELTIDPGFASKLSGFFVAVNPIFPGEHLGSFTFPIGGGVLSPGGSTGVVKSTGGIEFVQVGGGQFIIRNPEPEISAAQVNGEYQLILATTGPGPNQVGPILGLGTGVYSAEPTARTITASGAQLTLSSTMAQAFNEAFAKPLGRPDAFIAGETLGSIGFTTTGE